MRTKDRTACTANKAPKAKAKCCIFQDDFPGFKALSSMRPMSQGKANESRVPIIKSNALSNKRTRYGFTYGSTHRTLRH
jgi:hypothetical protein